MSEIDFNLYAEAYKRNRSVQPLLLERLLDRLALDVGDPVLEVGCGTANYLAAVVAGVGATGFGIDPAAAMLQQASTVHHGAAMHLMMGSAEAIPFPDDSFDGLYTVDVIHHVKDRTTFAGEAFRVLKSGGRFLTATDSHDDIGLRVPLASHFPATVAAERRRYPAIEVQVAELAEAGFTNIGTESSVFAYELTDIKPYRERAYSALRIISDEDFSAGVDQLEAELRLGPIAAQSRYTVIHAIKPE